MTTTYYSGAPNAPQRQTSRPIYTYHYFDVKGRGETPRVMFAAAGVDFIDERIGINPEIRQSALSKFPFKRVPVLEFDGVMIDQSTAICRYLGKELGLAGSSATEGFQIDALGETITEIREMFIQAFFEKDEETKKEKNIKLREFADTMHGSLQRCLESNRGGDGFFIGNKISWADLHFYCSTEILELVYPDALNNFAKLGALRKRVADQPRIAEYLKKRLQSPI